MTAPAVAFAIPALAAWIALHRIDRERARTAILAATAVAWTATILIVITWS